MNWLDRLKDAVKRKKSRDFAQELSNQFFHSPICSDYENLFAQVRPLIDEMKCVMPYGVTDRGTKLPEARTPELAWLRNPNDEMGWSEFADLMFATWLTEDELDFHLWRDKRENMETANLSYVFSRNARNDGYVPAGGQQVTDSRLYKIAKAFIGAIQ